MRGAVLAELVWRQLGAARASLSLIIDHLTFRISDFRFQISNSRYIWHFRIQILTFGYSIKDYNRRKVMIWPSEVRFSLSQKSKIFLNPTCLFQGHIHICLTFSASVWKLLFLGKQPTKITHQIKKLNDKVIILKRMRFSFKRRRLIQFPIQLPLICSRPILAFAQ